MSATNDTPEFEFHGTIDTTWDRSTPWWPEAVTPKRDAPNVVVVLFDDVGFGSFGCYGAEEPAGTVEHVESGERVAFSDARQLLTRLLARRLALPEDMLAASADVDDAPYVAT